VVQCLPARRSFKYDEDVGQLVHVVLSARQRGTETLSQGDGRFEQGVDGRPLTEATCEVRALLFNLRLSECVGDVLTGQDGGHPRFL